MDTNEIYRIKQKIMKSDPSKFWGDEFDIRFYLISKLKDINNCRILDVGGGIGILCSEMAQNNLRINLDSSFSDLKTCSGKIDSKIQNVCGSMETLPFKENYFDVVICSHLIEIAKHCAKKVITTEGIECCGFAGDRGFSYPELNKSALEKLPVSISKECKTGYSTSRTCEIGLSKNSGVFFNSIFNLLDRSISTNNNSRD